MCAITYLKIKKNSSTSLHCHPKKKTGFLILSGTAKVQVGIYRKNIFKCSPMSILVLREGLFHRIKASSKQDLYALEVETPYLKKDLVRLEDNYGRKNADYESLKSTRKISKKNIIFKYPKNDRINKYYLHKINLSISYYKNFNHYRNYDDKSVSIILDGNILSDNGSKVIGTGETKINNFKKIVSKLQNRNKMLVLKLIENRIGNLKMLKK